MNNITEVIKRVKEMKKEQFFVILLCGILLLVIALPTSHSKKSSSSFIKEPKDGFSVLEEDGEIENLAKGPNSEEEYLIEMEDKVEKILSYMDQVGRVEVLLTLESSQEKIVEKDIPVSRSNTQEEDAQGGSRLLNEIDSKETTIYETDGGKSVPYVIKTTSPRVEGVVVVCEGAGTGNVNKNISDAIQVLFGIDAHKIKVVKMKIG